MERGRSEQEREGAVRQVLPPRTIGTRFFQLFPRVIKLRGTFVDYLGDGKIFKTREIYILAFVKFVSSGFLLKVTKLRGTCVVFLL